MAILRNLLDAGVWVLAGALYLLIGFAVTRLAINYGAMHWRRRQVRAEMRQMEQELTRHQLNAIVTEKR